MYPFSISTTLFSSPIVFKLLYSSSLFEFIIIVSNLSQLLKVLADIFFIFSGIFTVFKFVHPLKVSSSIFSKFFPNITFSKFVLANALYPIVLAFSKSISFKDLQFSNALFPISISLLLDNLTVCKFCIPQKASESILFKVLSLLISISDVSKFLKTPSPISFIPFSTVIIL